MILSEEEADIPAYFNDDELLKARKITPFREFGLDCSTYLFIAYLVCINAKKRLLRKSLFITIFAVRKEIIPHPRLQRRYLFHEFQQRIFYCLQG